MPPDHDCHADASCPEGVLLVLLPALLTVPLQRMAFSDCTPCAYELRSVGATACAPLDSPTFGRGISEAGLIVGTYTTCGIGAAEAFLWDGVNDLTTLQRPPGIGGAAVYDVNEAGLMIGTMAPTGLGDRAFLHDGFQFIDLGTLPGGTFSRGSAINALGNAVGTWGNNVTGDPALAAFLLQDGIMIDLNAHIGTEHSEARDINDVGQIVGWMGTVVADAHAFIWDDGAVTDLGVIPGGFTGVGNAINELGWVAGSGRVRIERFPFVATRALLWDGSNMLNLGTLPSFDLGGAFDVNDMGQVVGRAWTFNNLESGFIWQNGVMIDLNDLVPNGTGTHITVARAINNQGQITGQADTDNGEVVAVLLTPIETVGDVDCDCTVGVIDLLALLAAWGPCGDCGDCPADLDGDCAAGVTDLLLVLANWN